MALLTDLETQTLQPEMAVAPNFRDFLGRGAVALSQIESTEGPSDLHELAEVITEKNPLVYVSMEFYDGESGTQGSGGLGVLAADTRRLAEQLGVPLVVLTPFYTDERHQNLDAPTQFEVRRTGRPEEYMFRLLGITAISTQADPIIPLDTFSRQRGSTQIVAITEPRFGELYPGNNSSDHRLYQETALGFAGYQAIKEMGINPAFMQLNEAPTVFAAIAWLDNLCGQGVSFDKALAEVKKHTLYTNHTLVQAVEGQFRRDQFDNLVMPNIKNEDVKAWISSMFGGNNQLKLSSLAIELAGTKSGVSKLHARVPKANFLDLSGHGVDFEAVTNGISRKWTLPEITRYYHELGILDEYDLPTSGFTGMLEDIDPAKMRDLKSQGRRFMNDVLGRRKDHHGQPINIPEDALLYNFKRRFADYKRPDMMFRDTDRLAEILEGQNAHLIMTGKPHPDDAPMKDRLNWLLNTIDANPILNERVHYVQDYDEELGQALAIGADCAINVPVVGQEACGTSWMKDMSNFQLVISTPDGGVADSLPKPIACLEVSGSDEAEALYDDMAEAANDIKDDARYKAEVIRQLREYLPVISGSRMMAAYLRLFHRLLDLPQVEPVN